ncbi:MAG: hypothetical protein HY698_05490 [Deltaproteobacteria bacterium]|nr:hypothetical protein [Deltaproteobacteria bacterium]
MQRSLTAITVAVLGLAAPAASLGQEQPAAPAESATPATQPSAPVRVVPAAKPKPAPASTPAPATSQPFRQPHVFFSPTAYILPAAAVQAGAGVDTGGALQGQIAVGLGDVAEFGVAGTNLVRARQVDGKVAQLPPYVFASFKMGVGEESMFRYQPAIALGFRKSFEHSADERKSRLAEMFVEASKEIGSFMTLHAGASFWDASLAKASGEEVTLHGRSSARQQLRPFGGVELRALPRAQVMAEVFWMPEFRYVADAADEVELRPQLAWGVRYELRSWGQIEAGVRVPDIADVNLLDAQIFGQLRVQTTRLRQAVGL